MGRPKGVQNRASGRLLFKLTHEHKFDVVAKIIQLFEDNQRILLSMRDKMDQSMAEGLNPTATFETDELALFNSLNKDQLTILMKVLAYCFPKLRSLEVNEGTTDKIVFNINGLTGVGTAQKQLPPNVVPMKSEG